MKKEKLPTVSKLTVVRQLCNYIPNHLVPKLARETGVDEQARTYDEWSHIVTLCYAQVTHSIGLNDVCDALRLNSGPLSAIRGATPPTRNNLSHANKVRDSIMAEKLFWAVYEHLGNLSPRFLSGKAGKRFARKFKRTIHLVDSTTIQLIASRWSKPRFDAGQRWFCTLHRPTELNDWCLELGDAAYSETIPQGSLPFFPVSSSLPVDLRQYFAMSYSRFMTVPSLL